MNKPLRAIRQPMETAAIAEHRGITKKYEIVRLETLGKSKTHFVFIPKGKASSKLRSM